MKPTSTAGGAALSIFVCCAALVAQAPADAPAQPARNSLTRSASGVPTFKVEVNLVLVEATVRDARGKIVEGLRRDDFHVIEDGVEQPVRYFSRDEMPLAVALVIDRSTSIAAVLEELRQAALNTLSLLKPEDQVAMFTFAEKPERAVTLTTDRNAIADEIPAILIGGGTDINDALAEAALYLGRTAPNRQHVIILISDNEATVASQHDEQAVAHTALETQTCIYSIEIGFQEHGRRFLPHLSETSFDSIRRIARETGGEVVELRTAGSIESAMAIVISRLQQRYTLGYVSSNKQLDGSFRRIDVRVVGLSKHSRNKYQIFTRRGYYAPKEHAAAGPPADSSPSIQNPPN